MKIETNFQSQKADGARARLAKNGGVTAFTLLEVMIAIGIFFAATFAILAVVGQCLRSARSLSQNAPTPGMVAAQQLSLTNQLEEGFDSGDFEDIAAGIYPDYTWDMQTIFYASNGLYQVDITVYHKDKMDSSMSVLAYKPESATGLSSKSQFRR